MDQERSLRELGQGSCGSVLEGRSFWGVISGLTMSWKSSEERGVSGCCDTALYWDWAYSKGQDAYRWRTAHILRLDRHCDIILGDIQDIMTTYRCTYIKIPRIEYRSLKRQKLRLQVLRCLLLAPPSELVQRLPLALWPSRNELAFGHYFCSTT